MANPTNKKPSAGENIGFLVMFFFIAGGLWLAIKEFVLVSPQVAAATVAGTATVLVSVFSVLWSKRVERQKEIEQEQRRQKIPVYEDFIKFIFRLLMAEKLGEPKLTDQEMTRTVNDFAQTIMVWGSDDVLRKYALFRRSGPAGGAEMAAAVESLLYAIRADIGHENKNLKTGELLSVFINDTEGFLAESETQSRAS